MKTLADLKRKMQLGVGYDAINTRFPELNAHRTVVHVQGNAIASVHANDPEKKKRWLWWPKASQVNFPAPNVAVLKLWAGTDDYVQFTFTNE